MRAVSSHIEKTPLSLPTRIIATFAGAGAMWSEMQTLLEHDLRNAISADIRELVIDENVLAKKTGANRLECLRKLTRRYGVASNNPAWGLFLTHYYDETSPAQRGLLAYVLLCANDALLRKLATDWLAPRIRTLGTPLSMEDLQEHLDGMARSYPVIGTWTELTRFRLCQHYLGLVRDCGLAEGKLLKRAVRPSPGNRVLLYALQLGAMQGLAPLDNIQSEWFVMLGLDLDGALQRMYELNAAGLIKFRLQGSVAELTLISSVNRD